MALELANIRRGDAVVVFGIVLLVDAVAGARLRGAGRIIAIGIRPNCVKLAKEYGATDNIISYKDGDIVKQILELEKDKVDSVILASGDASSINQALQIVRNNGSISNVNFIDTTETFHVPASICSYGICDINIKGGYCPGGALRMKTMLNLIRYGRVALEKMLNYKFEGFDKSGMPTW